MTPDNVGGRPAPEMTMLQAINGTLKELFRENPDTFLWVRTSPTRTRAGSST